MNVKALNQIKEFFADDNLDEEWFMQHMSINISEDKTLTITIGDMQDDELDWIMDTLREEKDNG